MLVCEALFMAILISDIKGPCHLLSNSKCESEKYQRERDNFIFTFKQMFFSLLVILLLGTSIFK